MDFYPLLKEFSCSCGKQHSCAIKGIHIGSGILGQIAKLTEGYRSILLVADSNTYPTCGESVSKQLDSQLENILVYQREGVLIPDEGAIGELMARVSENTDLILGIGSGVIQDLCKYASYQKGLPYHIIATAPSMDGYASTGAALILGGMKVTISCHVPERIMADVDILKNAPMELIQSGYGDILGKFSCLNDWKLSHVVRGEFFCQFIHDLMYDMVVRTKDLGPRLLNREPEAVQTLMEALAGAGVAMALAGNSRPASGSEHHLSHYFEITGILNREDYLTHGKDVAYSSIYTQRIRECLLSDPELPPKRPFCRDSWETDIRRVYTAAADGVIALQDKMGWYEVDRYPRYRQVWPQIREVLAQVPSASELERYLHSIGLNMGEFHGVYPDEKLSDALHYAKDLKDRYTVLWLYCDLNMRKTGTIL